MPETSRPKPSGMAALQALVLELEDDLVKLSARLRAARRSLSYQRHAETVARSLARVPKNS